MGLNPKGRDWGTIVNWDDLGKAYAGLIISWSAILLIGVLWLIRNRNEACVKIRNLPIAIASTLFLHVYLIKICLAYTTNGHFLCAAEFWIMSIYLPFGIALFQANLVQLSSISEQQRTMLFSVSSSNSSTLKQQTALFKRWQQLTKIQKTYCFIFLGMLVQFVVTLTLYLTTPTLQGDWKAYGNVPYPKGQALCRKSMQWIPSAFWQLFWSWIYGPYLLFSIRHINDTHYWRLQVVISVLSGLPGSPLWLAALFSPAFKPVNKRFVPPMWLAPGIMVMQFCTIFFPVFEVLLSSYRLREISRKVVSAQSNQGESDQLPSQADDGIQTITQSKREMKLYSMSSLEKALSRDPVPLLRFAATQDFSAENILFLMNLRRWRKAWMSAPRDIDSRSGVTSDALVHLFNLAVEIYISSVHLQTNDFPINIESHIRTALDNIFEAAVPEGRRSTSDRGSQISYVPDDQFGTLSAFSETRGMLVTERVINEYEDEETEARSTVVVSGIWKKQPTTPDSKAATSKTSRSNNSEDDEKPIFETHPCVRPLGRARAKIPADFNERVFHEAEKSIKYLVLTNTWQKFVKEQIRQGKSKDMLIGDQ